MRSIIERFASPIASKPVPVVGMHVVPIGTARRRALPQLPIQLGRYRRLFARADGLPHIAVPRFREVGPADYAPVNLFDDLYAVWRRALLRTHLHKPSVLLLRLHEHLSFSRIVAARFFYVDVLARLQPGDGHGCMPMVRSGNRDGVHILLFENRAKVFLHSR